MLAVKSFFWNILWSSTVGSYYFIQNVDKAMAWLVISYRMLLLYSITRLTLVRDCFGCKQQQSLAKYIQH